MRFRHVKLIGSPGSYQLSDSNRDLILDINDAAAMIWQLCGNENTVENIIRNCNGSVHFLSVDGADARYFRGGGFPRYKKLVINKLF